MYEITKKMITNKIPVLDAEESTEVIVCLSLYNKDSPDAVVPSQNPEGTVSIFKHLWNSPNSANFHMTSPLFKYCTKRVGTKYFVLPAGYFTKIK